jgi:hypothetical protein
MVSVKVAPVRDIPVRCSLTHLIPALHAPSRLGVIRKALFQGVLIAHLVAHFVGMAHFSIKWEMKYGSVGIPFFQQTGKTESQLMALRAAGNNMLGEAPVEVFPNALVRFRRFATLQHVGKLSAIKGAIKVAGTRPFRIGSGSGLER